MNIVDNDKKVDQIQFFGLKLEDATSVSTYFVLSCQAVNEDIEILI